ncbi:MAG: hypothetical protein QOJ45_410 [Verrucomicrobiota bacterium]|jgi:hypothetical protein
MGQRLRRRGHVLRVTAVVRNPGREQGDLAGEEISAPTVIAVAAMSAVPAYAHSLPNVPSRDRGPDRIDHSDDLMSGDSRILDPRPRPVFDQRIAVTNATRLHLDSHPSALRFRNFPLDQLQRSLRLRDLHGSHFFCHHFLSVSSSKMTRLATCRSCDLK